MTTLHGGRCSNEEATALGFSVASSEAEGALAVHAPMAVSCWRGRASVNHMVARPEAAQLAEKLRAAISKQGNAEAVEKPHAAPGEELEAVEAMEADATADAAAVASVGGSQ